MYRNFLLLTLTLLALCPNMDGEHSIDALLYIYIYIPVAVVYLAMQDYILYYYSHITDIIYTIYTTLLLMKYIIIISRYCL